MTKDVSFGNHTISQMATSVSGHCQGSSSLLFPGKIFSLGGITCCGWFELTGPGSLTQRITIQGQALPQRGPYQPRCGFHFLSLHLHSFLHHSLLLQKKTGMCSDQRGAESWTWNCHFTLYQANLMVSKRYGKYQVFLATNLGVYFPGGIRD